MADDADAMVYGADPQTTHACKRQWTLKGIEEPVIDAVRCAAKNRGMKVNAWVNLVLRVAAENPGIIEQQVVTAAELPERIQEIESTMKVEFERLSAQNDQFRDLISSVNAALVKIMAAPDERGVGR
jgi:hypothetical protein